MITQSVRRCALLTLASAVAMPAAAQDATEKTVEESTGRRKFAPEYFAAYSPVSAFDMVQRIPGFSIEGSEGLRGFGENAGNVLIDGSRPSTKTDDIFTLLQRIPASQVAYIELVESAGADGETAGKGQIVNVVRKVSNAISGTYVAATLMGFERGIYPAGVLSATMKRGATTIELNAGYDIDWIRGTGAELFRDGNGNLVERRQYDGYGGNNQANAGAAIHTQIGDAKINLNTRATYYDGYDNRDGALFDAGGTRVGTEYLRTDGPGGDWQWEIGGDVELPLTAKLGSKLIGLYQTAEENFKSSVETLRTGQPTTRFASENLSRSKEAVLRLQNDWSGIAGHQIQFGGEFAYNELRAHFAASNTVGAVTTAYPDSDVLVRETRFEPFLSDVWTISPQWKLEAGAIAEISRIKVTGDASAERSFQFIKPRLVATWTLDRNTAFEFRADRTVAQLNFGEFATSADIGAGNQIDAGNKDLVPEKVTSLSALVRHKFLERGSIQLKTSYEFVTDTQDLVMITERDSAGNITARYDGAGNIGDGKRWNAELDITLPMDWITAPLGIKGMEVKYTGHWHGSRVTDPITGQSREMSNRPVWHQNWSIRHDIGNSGFVWGAGIGTQAAAKVYFFNQYRRQKMGTDLDAFIEYKKFKFGTIKVTLHNLLGKQFDRDRHYYDDTRASGVLNQIVNRERLMDPAIVIALSGKF